MQQQHQREGGGGISFYLSASVLGEDVVLIVCECRRLPGSQAFPGGSDGG